MTLNKTLLSISVVLAGGAWASPYTGNDAQSNAMGNTGVASADASNAITFNPALLADYPDTTKFSFTLVAIKPYLEDPLGTISSTDDFIGNTFEDLTNVDLNAYNTALNGNGGSEASLSDVFLNLENTATTMGNLSVAIQNDANDNGVIDNQQNILDLQAANTTLQSNANSLDAKVLSIQTQNNNVTRLSNNAEIGLKDLDNKPLQLGLGIDALNVAIPRQKLGMAFGLSTSTTVGANAKVTISDLQQIKDIISDLEQFTAQVSKVTTELNDVTAANNALITLIAEQPNPDDYSGGTSDPDYIADLGVWGNNINTQSGVIENESDDVSAEVTSLEGITTSNQTVINGELQSLDFTLTSEVDIVGASTVDVAFSIAKRFIIRDQYVAVGITPKLQQISVFEKTVILEQANKEADIVAEDPISYVNENSTIMYRANVDIGAAKTWDYYGQVRAGVAIKDIIPWNLETDSGTELKIRPKIRIAAAHKTQFTTVAVDLDVTENKPLKYGVPTRYFGIGGELSAWEHAALRLGYRNNLSVDQGHVISTGIGITPFGTGLDISAWIKPNFGDTTELLQDSGVVAQFTVNF